MQLCYLELENRDSLNENTASKLVEEQWKNRDAFNENKASKLVEEHIHTTNITGIKLCQHIAV